MTDAAPLAGTPSHSEFAGMAVVVTGVGRAGQVGEVVAAAFAAHGATVHCIDHSAEVHGRVAELVARGGLAVAHQADLTDFEATVRLATGIAAGHGGRVAAVAALAGGFAASGPIAESDPAVYERQLAINLTSAYATVRAFLPAVVAARGAFVLTAAAAARDGGRVSGLAAYAMAKAGVAQLVRALAQETADAGVRVNAIAPTAVRTAANLDAMGSDVRYVEREELAATVVALCGPAFRRVTGQVFTLA